MMSNDTQAPVAYKQFIEDAKQFALANNLLWDFPFSKAGVVPDEYLWDLRKLTGSHGRHAVRLDDVSIDDAFRSLAILEGVHPAHLPQGHLLSAEVREFLKALVVYRCIGENSPTVTKTHYLNWRRVMSMTNKKPWDLSTEDLESFVAILPSRPYFAASIMCMARIVNVNMLSINCPLEPRVVVEASQHIEQMLESRVHAVKLPDIRALHEIARIVFQENPISHQDRVRFGAVQILILTGLRLNEVLMLPVDCLRREATFDVLGGSLAGKVGGATHTLQLKYFAEKDISGRPGLLVSKHQWIPEQFHGAIERAVTGLKSATAPLRSVLKRQREKPLLFPDSDLRKFNVDDGTVIGVEDLLLLVASGFSGELSGRVSLQTPVAPVLPLGLYLMLNPTKSRGRSSFFTRYGRGVETTEMYLRPHSLRHLLNTELFRLKVADTAITHHFGRASVTQSHVYDHRTFADKLAFVRLPENAEVIIKKGTSQELVAKMVISGVVGESHLAKSFRAIQALEGDSAAFRYLAATSDGFHVTPYGFCSNSFSMNPCVKHLKCFDKCKHYLASGLPQHKISLESLRERLIAMRGAIRDRPGNAVGRKNQMLHADKMVAGVNAAIDAAAHSQVFPLGVDHFIPLGGES